MLHQFDCLHTTTSIITTSVVAAAAITTTGIFIIIFTLISFKFINLKRGIFDFVIINILINN